MQKNVIFSDIARTILGAIQEKSHEAIYKTDTKKEGKVLRKILLLKSWKSDSYMGALDH